MKLLRRKGFKAVRLEDGILDWAALGLPLEARFERRVAALPNAVLRIAPTGR